MGKRVAILQSSYIPWPGYFDIIGSVDEFVMYDVVQFTKDDWRNRNRIKTADGVRWLTIPVLTAGRFGQTIAETRVAGGDWAVKHWRSLSQAYAAAPYFANYRDRFADAYRACGDQPLISSVNRTFIDVISSELGLSTRIIDAAAHVKEGDRNQRLVDLCRALGAGVYVSGPSARTYLDIELFRRHGIDVEFVEYPAYGPYHQLHGSFEPRLSVLDMLFNVGPATTSYLRCRRLA